MIKVSYLVTVFNKEKYIGKVLDSLKKVSGTFWKEFIIVNDGSTDNSLEIIKKHSRDLPNTTIISRENRGPSISTNEGLFLARGDYIKFLDGYDIIDPDAPKNLIEIMEKHNQRVSFGSIGKYDHKNNIMLPCKKANHEIVIDNPILALLRPKIKSIRTIGSSSSMVSRDLIEEIGGSDNEVFVQDFSLSLRCASRSNFVFCPKTVCYVPLEYDENNLSRNKDQEYYHNILALRNFIDFDPQISEKYKKEIYRSIISSIWKKNKKNYSIFPHYAISKIFVKNMTLSQLKAIIDDSIEKFFKI